MEIFKVNNEKCLIGVQHNAARDINIHHHLPETTTGSTTKPVEFHFPKPSDSFRGRNDELQQLSEWFFTNNKKMVVVCGCAGYGKTELCKQFVRQCKEDKKIIHILWLEAETQDKLMQSFKDLAKLLKFPEVDDQTLIQMVYQHFKSSSYIIIFDNAVNRQQIEKFVVRETGEGRCLVTSHVKDWGDDVPSLELLPLSLGAAVEVLHAVLGTRFKAEDVQLYQELASIVSCVPLALQVTAAYVRQEMRDLGDDFNLNEHLQHVKQSCEEFIDKPVPDSNPNTYDKSVFQAIQISLRKIVNINNETSKLACHVLHVCAYLYPDEILLSDLSNIPYLKDFLTNRKNPGHDLRRACSLLSNYSFISVENKKITIHRLIQGAFIYQQKLENHIYYYLSCLELLLLDNEITHRHRHFILQHAEQHSETFLNFYSKFKAVIISTNSFLYHLMATNCQLYLRAIFNELGDTAADVINKHCLLHEAVKCEQHDVLELLLARGADVSRSDNRGSTPLFCAADMFNLRALQILISNKSDVNKICATNNMTILHSVIMASGRPEHIEKSKGVCDVIRWLVECGAQTDVMPLTRMTLLHTAAAVLRPDLVSFLIREFHQSVHAVDNVQRTPLIYVCSKQLQYEDKNRRLRTAACLIEHGARLDVVEITGLTPAQYARKKGYEYIATFLENPSKGYEASQTPQDVDMFKDFIVKGHTSAIKQILDKFGQNASEKINEFCLLHDAVKYGHENLIVMLLSRGANINSKNHQNQTALHVAAQGLNLKIIQLLVLRGANVNAIDADGKSVLYYFILMFPELFDTAQQAMACKMLKWLVKQGARTNIVTRRGETLLHVAAIDLHVDLIEFLILDLYQDIHTVDLCGQTPLFYVVFGIQLLRADDEQGINSAACLLKHGARLDVLNNQGFTPAQEARVRGLEAIADYLENTEAQQISQAREFLRSLVATGNITELIEKLDEFEEFCAYKINDSHLLHVAVKHGQYGILDLLLARGADINHRDDRNLNALHIAARGADLQVVELLASHQADLHEVSVLHALGLSGRGRASCGVLHWLAGRGVDTAAVTWLGVSLLHVAAAALDLDLVRCLVHDFQHSVHVVDAARQTPLFYVSRGLAASQADEERGVNMVTCLLELGACADVVDVDGFTPAQDACVWGFQEVAAILEHSDAGAAGTATVAGSRRRWRWDGACVGVVCAAAAATAMHIYRQS